jgi:hypothetical protein
MRKLALLAPLAAAGIALAGCGAGGTATSTGGDAHQTTTSPTPKPPSKQQLQARLLTSDDLAPFTNDTWHAVPDKSSGDNNKIGCQALDKLTVISSDGAPNAKTTLRSSKGDMFNELVAFVPHASSSIHKIDAAIKKCPTITADGHKLQTSPIASTNAGDASTGLKAGKGAVHVSALFVSSGNYLAAMVFPEVGPGYAQSYYTALDKAAVKKIQHPVKPSSSATKPQQQTLGVGDSITTRGTKGPVKITLTGVAYPDYPKLYDTYSGPQNGQFLVVSYRAQALKTPTTLGAPISGAGFAWRGDHKTLTSTDGNASNSPWVGRVPEATSTQPIQPGKQASQDYTTTLDVPSKGGKLTYQAPGGQLAGVWKLPSTDTGPAAKIVGKATKELTGH